MYGIVQRGWSSGLPIWGRTPESASLKITVPKRCSSMQTSSALPLSFVYISMYVYLHIILDSRTGGHASLLLWKVNLKRKKTVKVHKTYLWMLLFIWLGHVSTDRCFGILDHTSNVISEVSYQSVRLLTGSFPRLLTLHPASDGAVLIFQTVHLFIRTKYALCVCAGY